MIRVLKGVQVFHEEARVFARGERIQVRLPHRQLGVANGQFAPISALDPTSGDATLRLGREQELKMNLKFFPHLDHGYAVTSHASQGATVDRVLVNIATTRSRELVNRQKFYGLVFADSVEASESCERDARSAQAPSINAEGRDTGGQGRGLHAEQFCRTALSGNLPVSLLQRFDDGLPFLSF